MQISAKPLHKLTDSLLFLFVTLAYLVIFIVTFKGFSGSDDMHYAMLASQVLRHRFDPFFAGDIFTGRLGLIYGQALLYLVGGINPVMTQSGTLFCTVLSCYLTIFHLIRNRTKLKVVLAGTIFYFTPVLNESILGIFPDAYVMLGAILVMIVLKNMEEGGRIRPFPAGLLAGSIIFITSLFKEESIILPAALGIIALIRRRKSYTIFLVGAAAAVAVLFSGYGLFLWNQSGDFFLRLSQISNGQHFEDTYPGKCHRLLSPPELVERLTYAPWKEAVLEGYFPVLVSTIVLVLERLFRLREKESRSEKTMFLVLLFTILYFPSRADHYQPVCADMRHYLLLLPFATVVMTEKITEALHDRRRSWMLLAATGICLLAIVTLSLNKWKWLTYGELFILSAMTAFAGKEFRPLFAACFFTMIAFLGLERIFFLKSNWYYNLKATYAVHGRDYCYMPDHDNFMHWRLFGGFTDTAVVNIAEIEGPPDQIYSPSYPGFRPGWIIVNSIHTRRSPQFFKEIDRLFQNGVLNDKELRGDVTAYRVNRPAALDSLRLLMQREPKR